MSKALVFLNGSKPQPLPASKDYTLIVAADGALNYLSQHNYPINYCVGDMDSALPNLLPEVDRIKINDQDRTDFDKVLDFLVDEDIKSAHVFGASGKEQDHFLGNLSSALRVKKELDLTFFDDHFIYFLAKEKTTLSTQKGSLLSLYPFPKCSLGYVKGLLYDPSNLTLQIGDRIGTRNRTTGEAVEVNLTSGEMWIFMQRN